MVVARYGTTELIADKNRYCNYIKTSLRSKINYLKDSLPYLEFDWDTYRFERTGTWYPDERELKKEIKILGNPHF